MHAAAEVIDGLRVLPRVLVNHRFHVRTGLSRLFAAAGGTKARGPGIAGECTHLAHHGVSIIASMKNHLRHVPIAYGSAHGAVAAAGHSRSRH